MLKNTSITLDDEDKEKIREMGLSVSAFARKSVEVLLSEGYDDYRATLKVKLLEEDLEKALEEQLACNRRNMQLNTIIESLSKLLHSAREELEISQTTGKLAKLTQKLNKGIITLMYDEAAINEKYRDIIDEMLTVNPEFDLKKHIGRLRKIMGY